jgi:transcriptional regulator with XRE-family HTH domain
MASCGGGMPVSLYRKAPSFRQLALWRESVVFPPTRIGQHASLLDGEMHSMETEMKINRTTVHQLRTDRGWSQEHLASVAGISLRTVQRVESEGSGSGETKMCLAAAFGIPVADLTPAQPSAAERCHGQAHCQADIPRRYAVAAVVALTALLALALQLTGVLASSAAWAFNATSVAASAAGLYGAFGLCLHLALNQAPPAARSVESGQ